MGPCEVRVKRFQNGGALTNEINILLEDISEGSYTLI
jgi:hypothetical protein